MTPAGGVEVVVATSNSGKLREFRALLGDLPLVLLSLADLPPLHFPDEGDDYAANAREKALSASQQLGRIALAEDSGLEVEGLGGAPGPHSARYGGPGLDDAGRVVRLLGELRGMRGRARRARFVCVAALAVPGAPVVTARGECPGRILEAPVGGGGFGYDPVFAPEQAGDPARAMAELPAEVKNHISHRAGALRGLADALRAVAARID
jgi:XTP/dITP diphosphohydrolase